MEGDLIGRADFAWEHVRLVGEFDGRVKYGRLLRPGQEPGDAVVEEKRREDAIRDADWGVVRGRGGSWRHPRCWARGSGGPRSGAAGA